MKRISAILLAAGESRRMGKTNKLEMEVNGTPLLRRTTKVLVESDLTEVVVVLGHQSETTSTLINDLPIKMVINDEFEKGQMSSVHKGLEALSDDLDGVMVCLSDQPYLETTDINEIIGAFVNRKSGSVLVPTYQGQRGNPIVLANDERMKILNGGKNLGCKKLIENNPDIVTTIEMNNKHVVIDLDTPKDYENFKKESDIKV